MGVAVKILDRKRPDYRPAVWQRYRLLCQGGFAMVDSASIFVPKHPHESAMWYEARLERFNYKNIIGTIVSNFGASVFQTPLQMQLPKPPQVEGKPAEEQPARPEAEQFYLDFFKDPTRDGENTFSKLMQEQLKAAMQTRESWLMLALPAPVRAYTSLYDQEQAGDLDVRLQVVEPETVINCGSDERGLAWVMLRYRTRLAPPLQAEPDKETIWWHFIDRRSVRTFKIEVEIKNGVGADPGPDEEAEEVSNIDHKLVGANEGKGAVPLLRIHLKPDLWMLDKIESVARSELRKRNELDWYESVACIPQLKYAGDEELRSEENPGKNARRGVQYAFEMGKDSELDWLELSGTSLDHMATRLEALEADIYKTVSEMAMSQGSGEASVLARSGASKMRDSVAKVILCMAYAEIARSSAVKVMKLVSEARAKPIEWEAAGCDSHDVVDLQGTADWFAVAQTNATKSQTLRRELEKRYARGMLQGADQSVLDKIEQEIADAEYPDPDEMELASSQLRMNAGGKVEPIPEPDPGP